MTMKDFVEDLVQEAKQFNEFGDEKNASECVRLAIRLIPTVFWEFDQGIHHNYLYAGRKGMITSIKNFFKELLWKSQIIRDRDAWFNSLGQLSGARSP